MSAVSLPTLPHNSNIKQQPRARRGQKKRAQLESQTTSMIVEVSNSSTSSSHSNGSFHTSFGSDFELRNIRTASLIEESGIPDINGNRETSSEATQTKPKNGQTMGTISSGVHQGIFTETPPSTKYLRCRFQQSSSSSGDDAAEGRSLPNSFANDLEKNEMIHKRKLNSRWSFTEGDYQLPILTTRNCPSLGDLI